MNWFVKMSVIAGAVLTAIPAIAEPNFDGYGHHPMMGWGGWFMGPVMMLIFFAFMVGTVVLIVRILGWHPTSRADQEEDRALAILRERFARGEIDQAEFNERRKHLQ